MLTSVRNSQTRNMTQALVIFLSKLRSGNSNKIIAAIFQLEQKQLVSEYAASIMNYFRKDVLPSRLGLNSISRHAVPIIYVEDVSIEGIIIITFITILLHRNENLK